MLRPPRIALPPGAPQSDGAPDVYAAYARHMGGGRALLSRLTKPSRELDPITRELIRLRNAELQGCNF